MLHTLHVGDVTRCNDVGSLVTKIHDNVTSQRDSTRNGAAMKHWKSFTSKLTPHTHTHWTMEMDIRMHPLGKVSEQKSCQRDFVKF